MLCTLKLVGGRLVEASSELDSNIIEANASAGRNCFERTGASTYNLLRLPKRWTPSIDAAQWMPFRIYQPENSDRQTLAASKHLQIFYQGFPVGLS